MQKTQDIPKVASKVIAITVVLILAFVFVFQIGYHLGRRSIIAKSQHNPGNTPSGVAVASPTEPEPEESLPEVKEPEVEEPTLPDRVPSKSIWEPEKVENSKLPVTEKPRTSPKTQYIVQVGAFRYASNANRVAALIESQGHKVLIKPPTEDSSLYIVRVGVFDSRHAARSSGEGIIDFIQKELSKMGYWVKREYRVVKIP